MSEAPKCRCEVLNQLTGDAADDYARHHLDVAGGTGSGQVTYRCPDTPVTWIEDRAPVAYGDQVRRLRRLDR